jgi:hypothetical protein
MEVPQDARGGGLAITLKEKRISIRKAAVLRAPCNVMTAATGLIVIVDTTDQRPDRTAELRLVKLRRKADVLLDRDRVAGGLARGQRSVYGRHRLSSSRVLCI